MKGKYIFYFFCTVFLVSCKKGKINLTQKVFEQVGYAKDQLSPEEIEANPEFANTFVTTRAKVEFLNDTLVNMSYWHYNQGEKSSECKYFIENSTIHCENYKEVIFLGQEFKIKNANTIVSLNGQLKGEYKLK